MRRLQQKLSKVYLRQQAKGGIIDLEEEGRRMLVVTRGEDENSSATEFTELSPTDYQLGKGRSPPKKKGFFGNFSQRGGGSSQFPKLFGGSPIPKSKIDQKVNIFVKTNIWEKFPKNPDFCFGCCPLSIINILSSEKLNM